MMPKTVETTQKPLVPLVESVLAFQFVRQTTSWDSVFFGKIHDRVEKEFPVVETLKGAQIVLNPDEPPSVTAISEVKRFSRTDGGIVLTVGAEALGVSVLARKYTGGYPGWLTLRQMALQLLEIYWEVTTPDAIRQIGVRYINSISVDPRNFHLDRYVAKTSGIVPESLMSETNPFALRVDRTLEASDVYVRREVTNLVAQATNTQAQLILDVDEIYASTANSGGIDVVSVTENLHSAVGKVFERILSESFRTSLGLVPYPTPIV